MENEGRALLEQKHLKEMKLMKSEIVKLSSLLEQSIHNRWKASNRENTIGMHASQHILIIPESPDVPLDFHPHLARATQQEAIVHTGSIKEGFPDV